MGKLFWKFFFFLWLAQVVTVVGVGATLWLSRGDHARQFAGTADDRSPQAGIRLRGENPPPFPNKEFPGHMDHRPPPAGFAPDMHLLPIEPILVGSVVSLLFAVLLAWYFAKPIRTLREAFESVSSGEIETRVGNAMGQRKDELADLGIAFDHMADRLENLIDTQRRLLHDVSHELRSPLTRLQAAAGLMRQQPERSAEFVERIERDTARMDRLIGELLTLARIDADMVGSLDEAVDLGELMDDIVADARFEADTRHCRLNVDVAEGLVVSGNRELLYRALENVVRNAIMHSFPTEHVIISAQANRQAQRVQVDISDHGHGVAENDLDAIFTPFFRSASAPASTGYGLGLAITRHVVEAHGGKVSASNQPQGGLLVSIVLPEKPAHA